jgi:hypothetical protein
MALIICHIIAYVQILSAGFNLWGVDPRIILDMPLGRNTALVGLFMLTQVLGLAGAIMLLQKMRLGYILSLAHHLLLLPALVITSAGMVMMMDDRINATILFMSKPNSADVSLFWSLGWSTVFQQVTKNVPTGSTYVGINLFALACAAMLWRELQEMYAADAEYEWEMRRRQRQQQAKRRQQQQKPLALPYYPPQSEQPSYPQEPRASSQQSLQQYLQQQRARPQQGARPQQQQAARQPRRSPPGW